MPIEKMNGMAPMLAKREARIALGCRRRVIQDIGCSGSDVGARLNLGIPWHDFTCDSRFV